MIFAPSIIAHGLPDQLRRLADSDPVRYRLVTPEDLYP